MGGTRKRSLNFVSDVCPVDFFVIACSLVVQFQEVGKSSILGKCARVYHYQYSRTFPALPDIFSLALRSYTSSITGEREEKRWERLIPSCDLSQEYERMRKQIGCPGSRRS